MVIPALSPGTDDRGDTAISDDTGSEQTEAQSPSSGSAAAILGYQEFAAALKDALRDFNSPDLLARNPLSRDGAGILDTSAGPPELRALLSGATTTLFDNPRDEKLRRVVELTYFQTGLKQEAVADRLSLSFGTYRRYLATARDRLTRWLWERAHPPQLSDQPGTVASATRSEAQQRQAVAIAPRVGELGLTRLSLAILPFLNIGSGASDHLADGITETLTTDLSRSSGIFVVSRNTAFAYKGKPIDTRQIGRELGVRYVLEGSIQGTGEQIRINAQLVDAESGVHLWADRFDKQHNGQLSLQDEITTRLTRSVQIEIIAAESRRAVREHPDRLDAVDHTLRGRAAWNQHLSQEAAQQARHFFEAALRLDEQNLDALLGIANTHMWEVNMYASGDRAGQIRAAEAAVSRALAQAPDSAEAHMTYGTVLFAMRFPERALREFQLAVSLDANLATAHGYIGLMKFFLGRAGETRMHVEEAIRLSPRDPLLFHWLFFIGVADVYLGRVVRGLENLRRSVEINPNWALSQFVLAGALGLAGLLAEASEVAAVARRIAPNLTIAKFRDEVVSDNPIYLAQREHFYRGLRQAGLPET